MSEGQYLVGVDIGSSAIKVCQLKDVKGRRTLVRFGFQPLPAGALVDGRVKDEGTIVDCIKKAFASAKIRSRDIAMSVSGQATIIKRFSLALLRPDELAEQMEWEAAQQIPYDIKDVVIDYEVLRRREDEGKMEILLVAAKKEELAETERVVRAAKLRPVVIDVNAFTVQNIFEANYGLPTDGTYALVNVGASLTSINLVTGGVPAFTREVPNGGNVMTEEIQKRMNISFEEAEVYKTVPLNGQWQTAVVPTEVTRLVKQMVESLAGEIQRTMDFYLTTSGEREIKKIYLTGGTSNIPELAQAIQLRARSPVEQLNPFKDIAVDPKEVDTDLLRARAAQATVALGLALRRDMEKRN